MIEKGGYILEKWEYTNLTLVSSGSMHSVFDQRNYDNRLNYLGEQGWELVSTFTTNALYGRTIEVISVFKRRKQQNGVQESQMQP